MPTGQSGTSCPVLYLFKAPLKSARKNLLNSIFLTRLRPLGCRLLPGAKKGGTPGFSFDGRGFCIKCKPPLAIKHETYKRKHRLGGVNLKI